MATFPIFDGNTIFGPWPGRSADLSVDVLLKVMESSNISRSLVTASDGIFYDFKRGNTLTLKAAKAHSNQLFPVGTLDPRAYPFCMDEAEKRASEGFRLFRFFPRYQKWPLRYAPFRDVAKKCSELKVPFAVQADNSGDCTDLLDIMPSVNVPVLLSGVGPQDLGEALSVMKAEPKFYIESTYLQGYATLETIRDAVPHGIERIVFASLSPQRYLSAALTPVVTSNLSQEEKALILGGNLRRLLEGKYGVN